MPNLTIVVDAREPKKICEILSKHCTVEVKVLEDGDYKIEHPTYPYPYLFSRKTVSDLVSSMNSGHWADECSRLLENYKLSSILIVEGIINDIRIKKSMWTLQVAIPISFTQNIEETAECLLHYGKKILNREMGVVNRRPVLVGEVNPIISYYAQIPGVGVERARRIYAVYPKPFDLMMAIKDTFNYDANRWKTKKEWKDAKWNTKIEGIGEDTASRIEAFLLDGVDVKC